MSNVGRGLSKSRGLVVLLAAAALLSGCAGGSTSTKATSPSRTPSPTPSPTPDTLVVDSVIDHGIRVVSILTHIEGTSTADTTAQFDLAAGEAQAVADGLSPAPAGVPAKVALDLRTTAQRSSREMTAAATCYRSAVTDDDCSGTTKLAVKDAEALGTAIASIIPFGSRSREEVLALFKKAA